MEMTLRNITCVTKSANHRSTQIPQCTKHGAISFMEGWVAEQFVKNDPIVTVVIDSPFVKETLVYDVEGMRARLRRMEEEAQYDITADPRD